MKPGKTKAHPGRIQATYCGGSSGFITSHGDIPMSVRAMKAGAVEFLTKPFRDQELLNARHEALTPREREVMGLVVCGSLSKQIAGELGASEITLKIPYGQAMSKMQAQSLLELVRKAEKLGFANPAERRGVRFNAASDSRQS